MGRYTPRSRLSIPQPSMTVATVQSVWPRPTRRVNCPNTVPCTVIGESSSPLAKRVQAERVIAGNPHPVAALARGTHEGCDSGAEAARCGGLPYASHTRGSSVAAKP